MNQYQTTPTRDTEPAPTGPRHGRRGIETSTGRRIVFAAKRCPLSYGPRAATECAA